GHVAVRLAEPRIDGHDRPGTGGLPWANGVTAWCRTPCRKCDLLSTAGRRSPGPSGHRPMASGVLGAGGLHVHRQWPAGIGPGLNRQLQQEVRSLPLARLDPDVSTHSVDELAADVQAQPRSADAPPHLRIESIELLEDPGLHVGRDSDAL